jgi:transcriptional regulator with XRE-family HTH domain
MGIYYEGDQPCVMRKPSENFFKAWRKYRGLTQEQVAERTEMDNTVLSKLENGKIAYIQAHLEALSHAYNSEPADLLRAPPSPERPEDDLTRHLRKLKSREDRARAARILAAAFGDEQAKA